MSYICSKILEIDRYNIDIDELFRLIHEKMKVLLDEENWKAKPEMR